MEPGIPGADGERRVSDPFLTHGPCGGPGIARDITHLPGIGLARVNQGSFGENSKCYTLYGYQLFPERGIEHYSY